MKKKGNYYFFFLCDAKIIILKPLQGGEGKEIQTNMKGGKVRKKKLKRDTIYLLKIPFFYLLYLLSLFLCIIYLNQVISSNINYDYLLAQ